jgi:hypothetical protein
VGKRVKSRPGWAWDQRITQYGQLVSPGGEKAITYSFARAGKRVQFPDGRDPATHTGAYEKETPNASELRSHYPAIYWLVCWISISGEDKA